MNAEISAEISARILVLMAGGMGVMAAFKEVCGSDKVDAMIGDLYEALRAKVQ
ncbi:hypothetical protein ACQUFY_21665 [Robbsia andropogonis]|uniref:hypothetical protein n=1 Tax=Robbsia andropogonis TaxID=28092 RepID=UPI003D1C5AC5